MKCRLCVLLLVAVLTGCDSGDRPEHPATVQGPYVPAYSEIQVKLKNGKSVPCLIFGSGYPSVTCNWAEVK